MAEAQQSTLIMPDTKALVGATKVSIKQDKCIKTDYWMGSLPGADEPVFLVVPQTDKTREPILMKSEEEYTSSIVKTSAVSESNAFIIETENSIYIVHRDIQRRGV